MNAGDTAIQFFDRLPNPPMSPRQRSPTLPWPMVEECRLCPSKVPCFGYRHASKKSHNMNTAHDNNLFYFCSTRFTGHIKRMHSREEFAKHMQARSFSAEFIADIWNSIKTQAPQTQATMANGDVITYCSVKFKNGGIVVSACF